MANKTFAWSWNFGVYPAVLLLGGLLWGSLGMLVLNFMANYGSIRLYDRLGRDWLGIELIKEVKTYQGNRRLGRLLSRLLSRGDRVALVALSVVFDPFITTAYLRHGANEFDGLNRHDWRVFLTSFTISTGYWLAVVYAGLSAIQLTV